MERKEAPESNVREFYDGKGWDHDESGVSTDAQLWEDLRPSAQAYIAACRRKLLRYLPAHGDELLDAASGPIQYPEYLEYSAGFRKRVCVDISQKALDQARKKLGDRGEYVKASILELPFADRRFDAVVSIHTIYHIGADDQERAVRELIRVTKPERPIVIIYSNPDRLLARIKRAIAPQMKDVAKEDLYFHPHPLDWWRRFRDEAQVELHPWRMMTAQDSRRLVPDNLFGKGLFRSMLAFEDFCPTVATRLGAYPLIVLTRTKS